MVRTFVVGDVHGQSRKLRELIRKLQDQAREGDTLVFVGDYVDRGPDSKLVMGQVLELVGGGWSGPVVTLKGNHEELMLDFLAGAVRFDPQVWLENGGRDTVRSYTGNRDPFRLGDSVPEAHVELLKGLRSWYEDEHGIYVHAGIPPGVSPEEADDEAFLWIREPFIESDYAWEKVVVFGHTPQHEPVKGFIMDRERLPWRPLNRPEKIGIDTGAGYGGPLTAVILPEREFVSVR
jgi:serine/threonine protein phosphatase 1